MVMKIEAKASQDFVRQHLDGMCPLPTLTEFEKADYREEIKKLLKEKNAVIVAHYYTDPDIQSIAEDTGGCVSDSLEMARFGNEHDADMLIVAGVKFMGETAKILTPNKRVLMPTVEATCSLDLGCPADEFTTFCDAHPDHTVVVYANTSAAVKARADWVVTSSIAVDVIDYLAGKEEKIIWAPDRHLGSYVRDKAGADVVLWEGTCIVHDEFKAKGVREMKALYPDAAVLVHPESPAAVVDLADAVGSTSQLIQASQDLPHEKFIVATDRGIFYKMRQLSPYKTFIEAPTAGAGATCRSCAHCPWMAMNALDNLYQVLKGDTAAENEIFIDETVRLEAVKPLDRMLAFSKDLKKGDVKEDYFAC